MGTIQRIIEVKDTGPQTIISIKNQSTRYFDEFLTLKCCFDLLERKIYPNSKEITEAMAIHNTFRIYFKNIDPKDETHTVVIIGDGSTPRLGALLAFRTKWTILSIDPALKKWIRKSHVDINRLYLAPCYVQDTFPISRYTYDEVNFSNLSIVLPHSHATMKQVETFCIDLQYYEGFAGPTKVNLIAMPCCVDQNRLFSDSPDITYADWGCWSPKKEIYVWKNCILPS